jgi:hypothetical protein
MYLPAVSTNPMTTGARNALELSLELLECGVLVVRVGADAFERFDVWNG